MTEAILESELKIEVVGTAQDGKTAIALVKKLRPDILLMDLEMPLPCFSLLLLSE